MKEEASAQGGVAMEESNQNLKKQLAAHMAQQPQSTRRIHRWLSVLTVSSLAAPAGFFVWALYLSINWKSIDPVQIPVAWLIFVASGALPILLFGLHAVIVRAFPALAVPGMVLQLATGSKAVASGAGLMLTAIAVAAVWGLVAYSVATLNWAMLEQLLRILGPVIGVGVAIAVAQSLFRQLSRSL